MTLLQSLTTRGILGILHSVFLLEYKIFLPQGVDTINHSLDKADFGVSKTMLVGNVISVASLSTRFTTGSTGLYAQYFTSVLKSWDAVLGPSGKVNVDGSSHASAKIGWARVDITELLGQLEVFAGFSLDRVLYGLDTSGQSFEYTLDITTLLHGDDSKLILFVDPDKECFGCVVEDTTASGQSRSIPATFKFGSPDMKRKWSSTNCCLTFSSMPVSVVVTGKIASEFWESVLHEVFNSNTLFLGDSRGQTESLDGSSDTNSDRVNWDIRANVSLDFFNVHVGDMFEASGKAMIFADEWVKDLSKVKIGVFVTSIDTAMLVIEFYCNSNSLCQSESGGLCDNSAEFVPFLFGDMLGNQGVLRFDFWEFCHCFVLFVLGRTILLKAER